ncbi:MAG: hypothetical protein GY895_06815 [Phycisphaera sp.]|nr:hypothetical protein [Phycisphaera sp.]
MARDGTNDERARARALLMADQRRWLRVVRWCAATAGLITLLSVLLVLLGIVSFSSFGIGLLVIAVTVMAGTFLVGVITLNLGIPSRLRLLDRAFSTGTDLELAIMDLLAPLYDESNESIEQRVSRVSAAIKAVDQEVVRARALGATATEVEVCIEMEIEDVPSFADCEPEVIGPVLDYLQRLRDQT